MMASKCDTLTIYYVHVEELVELGRVLDCITLEVFVMLENYPSVGGGVSPIVRLPFLAAVMTSD